MKKNVSEFIESIGGDMTVGARLGVHASTIQRWKTRGIPVKYWKQISDIYKASVMDLYVISMRTQAEAEKTQK